MKMNLLPKTEKEILKKGLKLRFVVVMSFLISGTLLAGLVMLLPSHFLALGYFSGIVPQDYYPGTKNENSMKKVLILPTEINSKLKFFQSNTNDLSVTESIAGIIGYLPQKITLNSVSFSRNQLYQNQNGAVILISGTALDRASLVLFSSLLKESNLFSAVEVPVSSLTRDKNLPFSMNIFIKEKNE